MLKKIAYKGYIEILTHKAKYNYRFDLITHLYEKVNKDSTFYTTMNNCINKIKILFVKRSQGIDLYNLTLIFVFLEGLSNFR